DLDAISADRPLRESGVDSLLAIELRNALGRRAGTVLPPSLAFDYPTPGAIAGYLLELMFPSKCDEVHGEPRVHAAPPEPEAASAPDEPIAIVGIACRLPGEASDPQSFWNMLIERRHAVVAIPDERWSADAAGRDPGARWGALLPRLDAFDAEFFGI